MAGEILNAGGGGGGSGTVTSVGLAMPSIFSVSGSPVSISGTLTASLVSQTANQVFAAPNGVSGAPSFRALVLADIAQSGASLNDVVQWNGSAWVAAAPPAGGVTSVALGAPSLFSVSGSPVTSSGTLTLAYATTQLSAPSDGQLLLTNAAGTDFSRIQLGGSTAAFPGIFRVGGQVWFRTATDSSFITIRSGSSLLNDVGVLDFITRSRLSSPADGSFLITNAAGTSFGLLQFGGTTSAFPALKRDGVVLDVRLADDSGDAPLRASQTQITGPFIGMDWFGNGEDGDFTFSTAAGTVNWAAKSGGQYTLTRDVYLNNLTWGTGGILITDGFRLHVNGVLDLTSAPSGTIRPRLQTTMNGGSTTTGSGGAGGHSGNSGTILAFNMRTQVVTTVVEVAGVAGSAASGVTGGAGAPFNSIFFTPS